MKKVFLCLLTSCFLTSTVFADNYDVELDSLRLLELQEVEIISTRATSNTPVAYSNMNKEQLKERNFGQDIPYLIGSTPSVIVTSDAGTGIGYTGFRVRGTDANRINITYNNVPLNDSESHGVFWVNLPDIASSLEDLQIQRGVGTSTNGAGAFGASVNMKTAHVPAQSYAEFNGGYGSFNTSKITLKVGSGTLGDHFAFDARLSSIQSDGFIDRASVDLKSYFFQASYFNQNTLLKFITFSGKEKTYHAWDGVPADTLANGNRTYNLSGYMGNDKNGKPLYYKDQTDNYHQTHYLLNMTQVFNPELNLNISLHYTRGLGYYEEYKQDRKLIEYGLKPFSVNENLVNKSDLVRQKKLDNDFGGLLFSLNQKKENWDISFGGGGNYYDGKHFGNVIWVKNYLNDPAFFPPSEYYRNTGEKTDVNFYLKGNYYLLSNLSVYGDVQYRFINYKIKGNNDKWDPSIQDMQKLNFDEQFHFLNPKAGIFYKLNQQNNLYASFAMAHREPNRNNYTDSSEKEVPKAERLMDYELGYNYQNTYFSAGVNLYYMKYKDQLILTGKVNEIGEPLTSNIPDSYRMGIELLAGIKIASWLRWDGNLTLSENKIKNYTEYVHDWETGDKCANYLGTTPIAYSPDLIVNSIFSFSYKSLNAGLQSNYVGKQYLDNSGSEDRKIDPYFVSNLRIGYSFTLKGIKTLGIDLLINNLFDEKYETNGYVWYSWYEGAGNDRVRKNDLRYFPQAGTNLMLNVSLRF